MRLDQVQTLVPILEQNSNQWGITPTLVPGVAIFKANSTTTPLPLVYQPSLCILVQGEKHIFIGDETYCYRPGQLLTVTLDLPLHSQITAASEASPYLLLKIELDAALIAELYPFVQIEKSQEQPYAKGLFIGDLNDVTMDAVVRLAELIANPHHIAALANQTKREIFYRLLCGPQGALIAQIAVQDSYLQRIAKALQFIKEDFKAALSVPYLAQMAGMSVSSFHAHFKNITGISPLQYQKSLRLMAARNLMLAENMDAATTAYRVGYESPSQFSREYARMFGSPPGRDVQQLKQFKKLRAM